MTHAVSGSHPEQDVQIERLPQGQTIPLECIKAVLVVTFLGPPKKYNVLLYIGVIWMALETLFGVA